MYDNWVNSMESDEMAGVMMLDLSAAFDLVSHDILQAKLQVYGLQSDFLEWIHSYMSDRYQSVWIDHVFSPCLPLDVGVPQGSNLGPLFFLLFANDLAANLGCDIVQYADDSTLSASCKTLNEVQNILENSCEAVRIWMAENQLQLNADKTHVMILGLIREYRT